LEIEKQKKKKKKKKHKTKKKKNNKKNKKNQKNKKKIKKKNKNNKKKKKNPDAISSAPPTVDSWPDLSGPLSAYTAILGFGRPPRRGGASVTARRGLCRKSSARPFPAAFAGPRRTTGRNNRCSCVGQKTRFHIRILPSAAIGGVGPPKTPCSSPANGELAGQQPRKHEARRQWPRLSRSPLTPVHASRS